MMLFIIYYFLFHLDIYWSNNRFVSKWLELESLDNKRVVNSMNVCYCLLVITDSGSHVQIRLFTYDLLVIMHLSLNANLINFTNFV